MRSIIYTLMFIAVSTHALCQSTISSVVRQRELFTSSYEMTAAGSKVLYLGMDYDKAALSHTVGGALEELKHAIIARIDLVYSDYPAGTSFSSLTKRRLEALQSVLPGVFLDKGVEFRKVRQTAGKTRAEATVLEHGFFIYYRPLPTKTSGREEAEKLKALLADTSAIGLDEATGSGVVEVAPPGAEATTVDTMVVVSGDHIVSRMDYSVGDLVDGTVTRVFKRHNWTHAFVLADVTGSMYPYTAQLLKWLQLNLLGGEKRYFMFFNDGDNKNDYEKVIGKTGGIYSVFTGKYDEVEKTIVTAMMNGSGGDIPENNIEALLASEKICSDCDSIVMIADNWAPIKDISLLASYHKPVKVVLCGVFGRINPDYLKLARDTKGSLHLIEEDIYTLSKLKEGETIKIHGGTYKLVDGSFVDVTPGVL